jgi:predicted ATPase
MKLTRIDIRFFRSFNYDYERKARTGSNPAAWEDQDPEWFPFIRVDLERDITSIVGANESGKSQLLLAVKAVLTGSPIVRGDFCRYSELYSVKVGELRLPEFGGHFAREAGDSDLPASIFELKDRDKFALYRPGSFPAFLVLDDERVELTPEQLAELELCLPTFHVLVTDVAIPASVSIAKLAGEATNVLQDRIRRSTVLKLVSTLQPVPSFDATAQPIYDELTRPELSAESEQVKRSEAEFQLARKLLVEAAMVDPKEFIELQAALDNGREGEVEAIVGAINRAIRENVNIQRWWSQDRDFELRVEARERELAFTIQDRTASKYSFDERSQGLRYFLSYFVQLTAHRLNNPRPDILLLDEPDAFLSSIGQQDLLRVLHDYSQPESGGAKSQVVYVTHSPFLVDKNAPYRIRVLDKGSEAEGTRVVADAANNRYEPLRSSLGQYVAETAFIGGQNLFVEGPVEQILVAGISSHITRRSGFTQDALDLNKVTLVSGGGADGIPYMVYLARGRDTIKPPCVVLLDGDKAGRDAERVLLAGEARGKRVIDGRFVSRLDLWAESAGLDFDGVTVEEIEDLLPVPLVRDAALNFLARFVDLSGVDASDFTAASIRDALSTHEGRIWNALTAVYKECFPGEHIEKTGLAHEIVSLIELEPESIGAAELRERFGMLFRHLGEKLEIADNEEHARRSDDQVKRLVRNFERNHPNGMKKFDAQSMMRELQTALGDADFTDISRAKAIAMIRDFELDDLSVPNVPAFDRFRTEIQAFRNSDRLAYQDDVAKNPAAGFPDKSVRAGKGKTRKEASDESL